MPTTFETLGIDQLTVREWLELIEQIWDSLPDAVGAEEVPEWRLAELAPRGGGCRARRRQAVARCPGAV